MLLSFPSMPAKFFTKLQKVRSTIKTTEQQNTTANIAIVVICRIRTIFLHAILS